MTGDVTLERIAAVLRQDVAPALEDEFASTQVHMVAVIITKLGRQLALETEHRDRRRADLEALLADLHHACRSLPGEDPIARALAAFTAETSDVRLSQLIAALYAGSAELGATRFDALLTRIRRFLRADIDRRMEFAR